jgi:NifU-like protein
MIEDVVRGNKLNTVEEVTFYTKAGGGCAACHEGIEEILVKVKGERPGSGETSPPPVCPASPETPKPKPSKLTSVQRIKKIEEVLDGVRPMLQRDHGDVELVEVQGKKIFVSLKGACSGCMMEAATLGGVQQKMIEALGELVQVLPVGMMPKE